MIKPLPRAIAIVGGQAALARELGVAQAHVYYWLHKAKRLPAHQARPIEKATGGIVTCHDLRPDLFTKEGRAA